MAPASRFITARTGKFETRAPVRTFVPFKVGNEAQLLAAYTCTPLVQFPISDLKPGAKIKGKTVAELGNRNRPLDMIVYQKDGKDYLLLANSSRGIMKISTDQIEKVEGIVAPVPDGGQKRTALRDNQELDRCGSTGSTGSKHMLWWCAAPKMAPRSRVA